MTPARVFGFVAAEADVCVLLRRGPSKRVLMVRWDLATDDFQIGQWLKGRVYEDLCDLSPNGRLFVYKALRHGRPHRESDRSPFVYASYTAVSRPPYFTALALWDNCGTWGGGGYWEGPTRLCLESGPEYPKVGIVRHRLTVRVARHWSEEAGATRQVRRRQRMEKAQTPLPWVASRDASLRRQDDADWADVDHRGRILLARAGRVYVRDTEGERELIDLNPYEFQPLAPPAWATEWPA